MAPPTTEYIILDLLCPSLGVLLATLTFGAPIKSLRERLLLAANINNRESSSLGLGDLNPLPWAVMTGNCLGWIAYSYLTKDLFVLFANVPGLMVSIWLNLGAIKLQYRSQYSMYEQRRSASRQLRHRLGRNAANGRILASSQSQSDNNGAVGANSSRNDQDYDYDYAAEEIEQLTAASTSASASTSTTVPHERTVLWVLFFWVTVCSLVAHVQSLTNYEREQIIGYIVNLNLCFFYFAPLTTIVQVCHVTQKARHRSIVQRLQ